MEYGTTLNDPRRESASTPASEVQHGNYELKYRIQVARELLELTETSNCIFVDDIYHAT